MSSIGNFHPVQSSPFTSNIKIKSYIWRIINGTIFMLFPVQFRFYRIFLLRLFGAKLANNVTISRKAKIEHPWNLTMGAQSSLGDNSWTYCLEKITIGEKCCIGKDVYLITGTHDFNDPNFTLVSKPIIINNGCWVATGAYILPNITLGAYTVVGAGSVVIKNTEEYSIVAGNPAKLIKKREIKY